LPKKDEKANSAQTAEEEQIGGEAVEKAPLNSTFTKEDIGALEPVPEEEMAGNSKGGRKKTPPKGEEENEKKKPVRGRAKKDTVEAQEKEKPEEEPVDHEVKMLEDPTDAVEKMTADGDHLIKVQEATKKHLKKSRSKRDINAEEENKVEQQDAKDAKKPSRSRAKKDVNDIPEETGVDGDAPAEKVNDDVKDEAPAKTARKPRAKKAAADDNKENADGNKRQVEGAAAAPKGRGRKK